MMLKLQLFLLLFADVTLGARRLRDRGAKSLVNTFPFNSDEAEIHQGHHDGHHHEHHEHNAAPSNSVQGLFDARDSRQGSDDVDVSFPAVAAAGPGSDGKRCLATYVTQYESQQEEDCEENFRKSCFIEYEQIAFNETATICRTPLVKDCDVQGPEICRTEYESEC